MDVINCEINSLENELKLALDFVQRVKLSGAPMSADAACRFKTAIIVNFNEFEKSFVKKQCDVISASFDN